MIENKENSFMVKGFFVRTNFFTEQSVLSYFSELVYLAKLQLQNTAIIAYFDFYCSLSIVIVVIVISIAFS